MTSFVCSMFFSVIFVGFTEQNGSFRQSAYDLSGVSMVNECGIACWGVEREGTVHGLDGVEI